MKYAYVAKCALKQVCSGFGMPFMAMLEITLMCNMFCEYCIFGEEGKFNDLGTRAQRDHIFRRIDELCDMGVFALSFSGGEPLMNPNAVDYLACAADRRSVLLAPGSKVKLSAFSLRRKCSEPSGLARCCFSQSSMFHCFSRLI